MATLNPRINPDHIHPLGEWQVIKALLNQLPEQAIIYHNFEALNQVQRGGSNKSNKHKRLQQGEMDVVVVLPERGVLVLEVRGGRRV